MANTQRIVKADRVSRGDLGANKNSCRVVKLGGSLLNLPDLSTRIALWLNEQEALPTVWIVGGGKDVDALRGNVSGNPAEEESMHWTAVEVMSSNVKSVQELLFPKWKLLLELETLVEAVNDEELPRDTNLFFDSLKWLRCNSSLPRTWDVTSDSIALSLAGELMASEVVLLKSVEIEQEETIADLVSSGVVDAYFEIALEEARMRSPRHEHLSVRFENIRS